MQLRGAVLAYYAQDPGLRHLNYSTAATMSSTVITMLLAYKQKSKVRNNNNRRAIGCKYGTNFENIYYAYVKQRKLE